MASLRRHPYSPYWIACFRDSNGNRTTRTTKTKDRSLALKMAVEWEGAARKASTGRLAEAQARAVINSILEHAGEDPVVYYKTRDWFTEWLDDKKRSRKKTTIAKYEQVVTRFLKHLGRKADGALANVQVADVRSFREILLKEGRAASTVNDLASKILFAPFAKAVRLGYLTINPCAAIEPLMEADTTAGVFTVPQVKALVRTAPTQDWKGFILAGFYTGQRMGDLSRLTWKQVDLSKQLILISRQGKTGVGVAIPIHAELLHHFHQQEIPDNKGTPVFPELFGKSGSGKSGLSESFKRIMKKSGIVEEKRLEATGKIGRGRNKLSFHSLRHSFNSAMANAGVTEEVRRKLTGHRDKETHQIYTHLDIPTLKQAVDKVPLLFTNEE